MTSLPAFLLARLNEDEAAAKAATQGNPRGPWRETVADDGEPAVSVYGYPADPVIVRAVEFADAEHVARHDPARVLADVEAKRRIVVEHGPHPDDPGSCVTCSAFESTDTTGPPFPCPTLRLLALPYADHPDYRAEWAL